MKSLSLNVMEVVQPIGTFYAGVVRADDLFEISKFDYRRMEYTAGYIDFIGIQRPVSMSRVRAIVQYVNTADACFPTSVVISIDAKCVQLEKTDLAGFFRLRISEFIDANDESLSIPFKEIASIIDGQHRLKGLFDGGQLEFEVPVSIFIGADDATEATIFSTVNIAQTKVNKSLGYDLFAVAKKPSPEKTCHEITVLLDRLEFSPFHNKIKRLGVATEGRFGETLSQATIVQGILPYISNDPVGDRDRGKRFGFWEPLTPKIFRSRIFYGFFAAREDVKILEVLINYFSAARERWPRAWNISGERNILTKTNGYNGLMRFLKPCYLYITSEPRVVTQQEFLIIFKRVSIADEEFSPINYLPGSSGSSKLYRDLCEKSGIGA